MKKRSMLLAAVAALFVTAIAPAGAVTKGGTLDGDAHPYVGIMVAKDGAGDPMWRCSGTLISDKIFVTAGHCTFGATSVEIWFEGDLEPDPSVYGYPNSGSTSVSGTPFSMPGHSDSLWFLYDLGVVVLSGSGVDLGPYPALPTVDQLDDLGKGRNQSNVTAVGYGLQEFVEGPFCVGPEDCSVDPPDYFDPKIRSDKTRYKAELMVVDSRGVAGLGNVTGSTDLYAGSFMVSGDSRHGGTCFGDSGGPMLMGNVLVGVNSFGLNPNCAGVGGAFRVDQPASLAFIKDFLP